MRFLKYFLMSVVVQISLTAQVSLESELEKIKEIPGITVEHLVGERISVNYSNLKTTVFNLGGKTSKRSETVPRFVFNLWDMDTSLFNYKYSFWQEVPLGTYPTKKPLLGDMNNNVRAEFYGHKKDYFTDFSEVWCYEQDLNGIFKPLYKYAENTLMPYNIYDIDRDGSPELHLIATHLDSAWGGYVHDQTFFKKSSDSSLATLFYFDYNIFKGGGFNIQLNDFTICDFNYDGINEAIFFNFSPQEIRLVKFNETELRFDSVLAYPTWYYPNVGNEYIAGFVTGDFDKDNKTDIIYSSEYGNIYILENEIGDNYSINWEGNSGIRNSYINFQTKDIDKNGKAEFWIGGESFAEGVTRLVCYETNGDDSYQPVVEIEFPGLASLNGLSGMSIDVDIDGKEELFINVGNLIVIVKFIGEPDNHNYEIYYFHQFDNVVQTTKMFMFPDEDYPSIILSMYQSQNGSRRDFTQIFRHYLTTHVEEESGLLNDYKFDMHPNKWTQKLAN